MAPKKDPAEKARLDMLVARTEKAEADAALAAAEAFKVTAEARKVTAEAEREEINLAKDRREEEERLAADKYHYVYAFTDSVSSHSVEGCIEQLTTWMRTSPDCSIEIIFHSPGGEVIPGMALFDFIQRVRAGGHHVTTMALGMAASMAGILLQAGDHRVMGKEAWVLIHEASFGAVGKVGEVEDVVEWVKKVQKRILNIFASRSKLTARQIARRWKRKDWWLSSEDCLELGFVDEVAK